MSHRRRTTHQGYANARDPWLDAAVDQFAAEVGIARYGHPEDVANAVAFLFAPASYWTTGRALRGDGGETRGL